MEQENTQDAQEVNRVQDMQRWFRLRGNAFRRFWKKPAPRYIGTIGLFFVLAILYAWAHVQYPSQYASTEIVVSIPSGASVQDIASILSADGVIENPRWFTLYVRIANVSHLLQAGEYYIPEPISVREITRRLVEGDHGMEALMVTLPEGATSYQMADILAEHITDFDAETFLRVAETKEGYLFPDTYRFLPHTTAEEVLHTLERTFYEKITDIEHLIASSSVPVHHVVTMASLIEREASDFDQRRLIAGILWNRIAIDMPLQVDAVFGYIQRRETFHPLFSDLEVDSPYNTYKNIGLPPGPIGNPSLEAMKAVVMPVETEALYYLHGKDGSMHIAETFDKHRENRARYL